MSRINQWYVGGYIRDQLLNIKSKDIDIAVEGKTYPEMKQWLLDNGYDVRKEEPQYLRIKAVHPEINPREYIDFVLCREDGYYSDFRRPDCTNPSDILTDLARRDFTCNAIAMNVQTGQFLDPHNGRRDTELRILRAVGDPNERLQEDPLRILRAIRFAILKGFMVETQLHNSLLLQGKLLLKVEPNRIREELVKPLKFNTFDTIAMLCRYRLLEYCFNEHTKLWLKPTSES